MLAEGRYAQLERYLGGLHRSYEQGTIDDVALMSTYRMFYEADPALKPYYDEWIRLYPDSYPARLARGIFEKYLGREAAGEHSLNELSGARVEAVNDAFEAAREDLNASLAMDAHGVVSYVHLIDLAKEGPGALIGLSARRKVLDEALERNPLSFVIRRKYLGTLESRRGHSTAEMQKFFNEVAHSRLAPAKLQSLDALVLRDRGWVADRDGQAAAALRFYEQAATEAGRAPELMEKGIYADILIMLGRAYEMGESYAKALEQFDKLLRLLDQTSTAVVERRIIFSAD